MKNISLLVLATFIFFASGLTPTDAQHQDSTHQSHTSSRSDTLAVLPPISDNWRQQVENLMLDNKNKEALLVLKRQGEILISAHQKSEDSLKSSLAGAMSAPVSNTPAEPANQQQPTTVVDSPAPVHSAESNNSNNDNSGLWGIVLLAIAIAGSAGFLTMLFRKHNRVASQYEKSVKILNSLTRRNGELERLEQKAGALMQRIEKVIPVTTSETNLFSVVVQDKNNPFIKPVKEVISGTQILRNMVADLPTATATEPTKCNINRLIEEVSVQAYYSMRDHYPDFSCSMTRDLEKILPDTEINQEDIKYVLFNLLENAFESVWKKSLSTPKGYAPAVTITSRKLPRYIQIRVKDNGFSVPDHVRKQIFEPFFTTRENGENPGLGLSESYDLIVNKYKGDLFLENDFQSSTDFIIRLPLKP